MPRCLLSHANSELHHSYCYPPPQVPLYALNQYLVFNVIEAIDVGGSITIHAFVSALGRFAFPCGSSQADLHARLQQVECSWAAPAFAAAAWRPASLHGCLCLCCAVILTARRYTHHASVRMLIYTTTPTPCTCRAPTTVLLLPSPSRPARLTTRRHLPLLTTYKLQMPMQMQIRLQGAYYGLAASLAISARQTDYKTSNPKNAASYISNLFSMIGERPRTAHLLFYQLRA